MMSTEYELFKDVKFRTWSVGDNEYEVQAGIKGNNFPVVKIVPKSSMYVRGLEMYHKPLVDRGILASGLAELLTAIAVTGKFNENRYNSVLSAYDIIIDIKLKYDALVDRVRMLNSNSGWE